MSIVNFLLERNRQINFIPHHRNHLSSMLTDFEKDLCYSFEQLSYPVIRLSTTKVQFKHSDTRFQPCQVFIPFVNKKRETLVYNEMYHIRCKSITMEKNRVILETEWSDSAQFLGTNMMIGSCESLREMVKDHYPLSPLLANELAAIATFIVHDENNRFLMLTKRGIKVATYANCMSASVSGAMGGSEKWTDFTSFTREPDPIMTIIRETKEELGIDIVNRSQITTDALCIQAIDKQPIFLVSGELYIPKEEIIDQSRKAKDKDEIEDGGILFIPFNLKDILPYLLYLEYSPISAVGIWTLLEKYFSKDELKRALTEIVTR